MRSQCGSGYGYAWLRVISTFLYSALYMANLELRVTIRNRNRCDRMIREMILRWMQASAEPSEVAR